VAHARSLEGGFIDCAHGRADDGRTDESERGRHAVGHRAHRGGKRARSAAAERGGGGGGGGGGWCDGRAAERGAPSHCSAPNVNAAVRAALRSPARASGGQRGGERERGEAARGGNARLSPRSARAPEFGERAVKRPRNDDRPVDPRGLRSSPRQAPPAPMMSARAAITSPRAQRAELRGPPPRS
jgi:hypothetical protein